MVENIQLIIDDYMAVSNGWACLVMYCTSSLVMLFGLFLSSRIWSISSARILLLYMIMVVLFTCIEIAGMSFLGWDLFLVHALYGQFEFLLCALLLVAIMPRYRKLLLYLGVLVLLLIVFDNYLFRNAVTEYAPLSRTLPSIFLSLFAALGFYSLFVSEEYEDILIQPEFWVLSGLLIYHSGAIFLFLMGERIFTYEESAADLWFLHNILATIKFSFSGIAFWRYWKRDKDIREIR